MEKVYLKNPLANVVEVQFPNNAFLGKMFLHVEFLSLNSDASLLVRNVANNFEFNCCWLENSNNDNIVLNPGDQLLCIPPTDQENGVVLGRIGKYQKPQTQEHVTIEATETLTLKCGESSVELRSDGRTMLKGEDVLLRAKGTQRIRAAAVAIN